MKIISRGLAVLIAGLAFAAGAHAQDDKPKDRRALLAEATADAAREKGMKMAPALVASSSIFCNVTDARYIQNAPSELNGKRANADFIEVSCEKNLGYVLGERKDGVVVYDCIEMSGKGSDGKDLPLKCRLEGNKVPSRGFQAQLDAAGVKCAISAGRFVGFSPTASVYELGCSKADGVMLTVATPRTATSAMRAVSCASVIKSDNPCALTKPEQSEAYVKAAAAAAPKPVDPAVNLAKGKTMAPAMLAENQIPCTVTEANFLFNGKMDVAGKKVDTDFVEVACEKAVGHVLAHRKDGTFTAYDCISTSMGQDGKDHPLKCKLPGNKKPWEGLTTVLAANPVACQPTNAILFRLTPVLIYEVACANADGQMVVLPQPRTATTPPAFFSCYSRLATEPCTLTTKEQTVGYILALAQKAPKPCAATEQRFVTRPPNGSSYYEFACPDKTGFMVETNASGAFVRAIPCAAAIRIAGGCKLTGGPAA